MLTSHIRIERTERSAFNSTENLLPESAACCPLRGTRSSPRALPRVSKKGLAEMVGTRARVSISSEQVPQAGLHRTTRAEINNSLLIVSLATRTDPVTRCATRGAVTLEHMLEAAYSPPRSARQLHASHWVVFAPPSAAHSTSDSSRAAAGRRTQNLRSAEGQDEPVRDRARRDSSASLACLARRAYGGR